MFVLIFGILNAFPKFEHLNSMRYLCIVSCLRCTIVVTILNLTGWWCWWLLSLYSSHLSYRTESGYLHVIRFMFLQVKAPIGIQFVNQYFQPGGRIIGAQSLSTNLSPASIRTGHIMGGEMEEAGLRTWRFLDPSKKLIRKSFWWVNQTIDIDGLHLNVVYRGLERERELCGCVLLVYNVLLCGCGLMKQIFSLSLTLVEAFLGVWNLSDWTKLVTESLNASGVSSS